MPNQDASGFFRSCLADPKMYESAANYADNRLSGHPDPASGAIADDQKA